MSISTEDIPVTWLPVEALEFSAYACYLAQPDDFIDKDESGKPVVAVRPEDDGPAWSRPLRDGDIVAFQSVQFFDEDMLTIGADGSWSTGITAPSGFGVRYGDFGNETDCEDIDGAANDLFASQGPGSYPIAYLNSRRTPFVFRNDRFQPE